MMSYAGRVASRLRRGTPRYATGCDRAKSRPADASR
jgi:hypothetical protein